MGTLIILAKMWLITVITSLTIIAFWEYFSSDENKTSFNKRMDLTIGSVGLLCLVGIYILLF